MEHCTPIIKQTFCSKNTWYICALIDQVSSFKASFNKFQRICNMQKDFLHQDAQDPTKTSLMYFGIIIIKKPLKIKIKKTKKKKATPVPTSCTRRRHGNS